MHSRANAEVFEQSLNAIAFGAHDARGLSAVGEDREVTSSIDLGMVVAAALVTFSVTPANALPGKPPSDNPEVTSLPPSRSAERASVAPVKPD
jgi:hypothetical protein